MKIISIVNSRISLLLIVTIFINSCKHDTVIPVIPDIIQLQTSSVLGTYLADKDGRTLYMFSNDANGQPNCTGSCELTWPPFNIANFSANSLDPQLKMSDFAVLTTTSGKQQLSYKGWPLYLYAPAVNGVNTPEVPKVTSGDGVAGIWFIAKPDYSIMFSNAQLIGHDGKNYKADYTVGDSKTIYFTDGNGLTLYGFRNDKYNKNNYTKADFSNNSIWPIYETDKMIVPSAVDKSLFSAIDVFGKKQLTYKGWPLYYFIQDAGIRGANKGISFPAPSVWPVLTKNTPTAPL